MKHLRVLEEAQLIVSKKNGRSRELYFNVTPIQLIYDRWTTEYSSFWASKVADLKHQLESTIEEDDEASEHTPKTERESKPESKPKVHTSSNT